MTLFTLKIADHSPHFSRRINILKALPSPLAHYSEAFLFAKHLLRFLEGEFESRPPSLKASPPSFLLTKVSLRPFEGGLPLSYMLNPGF